MAFTHSMESQMLRNYEAKCEIVTRLLDKIITCHGLAFAKDVAFEAKEVLQYGL